MIVMSKVEHLRCKWKGLLKCLTICEVCVILNNHAVGHFCSPTRYLLIYTLHGTMHLFYTINEHKKEHLTKDR